MADKLDKLRQELTDRIVGMMETAGTGWVKSWSGGAGNPCQHNGKPYRGINLILLGEAGISRGYTSPYWLSFKQISKCGGKVKKGERGEISVFFKPFKVKQTDDSGDTTEKTFRMLRYYRVWNVDQCEGLPKRYTEKREPLSTSARDSAADKFFADTGADIRHSALGRAFYQPTEDFVHMPNFGLFNDANAYYATLAHECTHWTGHKSRRDRLTKFTRFGDEAYAFEELIAELGAAFLCAELGLASEPREDHAKYLASWIRALKNDKTRIFTAAAAASYAVDYLHEVVDAKREAKAA